MKKIFYLFFVFCSITFSYYEEFPIDKETIHYKTPWGGDEYIEHIGKIKKFGKKEKEVREKIYEKIYSGNAITERIKDVDTINLKIFQYGVIRNDEYITDLPPIPTLRKKGILAPFKKENREDIVEEFKKFKKENSWWLDNYSLYMFLKFKFNGKSWQDWSKDYKYRNVKKMLIDEETKKNMDYFSFVQYTFYKQWFKLKEYANSNGIKIIGDIPIFVATDSADTWSNSEIFQFDKYKRPKRVAGCPPDYFSKDGQLWGNVLYDWMRLKESGYHWWIKRIEYSFKVYDVVRIDHFRGFEAYWSISAKDKTAVKGHWEKGPGIEFFRVLERRIGKKPIIAEDLGLLTDGVRKLLKRSGFPGMKILEFAFDSNDSDYLPHKYEKNSVAYTGTHDNNTVEGWYKGITSEVKYYCDEYLKKYLIEKNCNYWDPINWRFINAIWASEANIAIVQMQVFL